MPPALLLDADVPPRLADALRTRGYDVVASSGDPSLESLSDAGLLAEALRQDRILVTFNVVDFVALTRDLARVNRAHAGVILIHARTFQRSDIGGIARGLDALLQSRRDLRNTVFYLSRQGTAS